MVSSGMLRRATRRKIPEDTILHSHRRENLKSYTVCSVIILSIYEEKLRMSSMKAVVGSKIVL
jgi:hypothetical protein